MPDLDSLSALMMPAIEAELQSIVSREIPHEYPEIRVMMAYHLGWEGEGAGPEARGKRIRPLLVLLSSAACKTQWEPALPAAAAVELLHNFSLIHDDIQDQSSLRHGRPTIWTKWGVAQAINAGDVMYTLAYKSLHRLERSVSAGVALQAVGLLEDTCLRLTEGQYLDMRYENAVDLSLEAYWPMIAGKTAALLGTCAQLGALAACAGTQIQLAFYRFGHSLGLAFQVLDDALGIWGESHITGKSNTSDLVTGKKTLPVLYGLSLGRDFARRWKNGPISTEEVSSMANLLAAEGAREYTQAAADRLSQEALDALDSTGIDPQLLRPFRELAQRLLNRKA